ncbi:MULTISPECIES: sugar MFS transporter [Thalassotalea]|uniref:sugar MFS transporter n=1 Tax=Thalassotalea TaxID=1518149 RepID=UPI000943AD44|nr:MULTISPECIES: sugar MFS transporter [Thalassotalea]OKY26216.1 glucose/galactose MFS transporter [Thalassotalea sp. PP2-459]
MSTHISTPDSIKQGSVLERYMPMLIIGGLFFMFGFVTWLNGSLIPFLQITCELNHFEAYFVTLVFYIAYTVMALPAAKVLKSIGYKKGIVGGLVIMTVGALVFIPAAQTKLYSIFLIALFLLGTGLTVLQTAANPYLVVIGPQESAAVRISIMGILNKGAGIIAPIFFTAFVLTDMSQFNETYLASLDAASRLEALQELSSRLILPYFIMAGMLALLAVFIYFSPLPDVNLDGENDTNVDDVNKVDKSILQYPHLILGVLTLFFYIGVEVIAGDTIGLYGKELGVTNFGQLTSYTMAFMVVAYIIGIIVIPRWISQEKALVVSAVLGLIFSTFIIMGAKDSHWVWDFFFAWTNVPAIPNTVLFVALLGLANALVWPAVWPMALKDLGKQTATGSAVLIMGISGGALLPLVYGAFAEQSGNSQMSYWIMLPCYLFILYYALIGHKKRHW